jgi:hypothetical protein
MSHHEVTCPSCQSTAQRMPVVSDISVVDFYQCGNCRMISLTPKNGSGPVQPFKLAPIQAETPAGEVL